MDFEIIDFHTHPFSTYDENICGHKDVFEMSRESSVDVLKSAGISKICGSVVSRDPENKKTPIERIIENNNSALALRDFYKGFYVPGFHIHPDYIEESISEINRMHKEGVKLIGEIVPSMFSWSDYGSPSLSELLTEAGKRNMVVSFHTIPEYPDAMETMVKNHPDVIFVAAHPGEYPGLMAHIERGKKYENYYLDISGTGLFRYGMLRRAIDSFGADRILFGSDYPTCNPAMFVGGVLFDSIIKDSEKEQIFSLNAKRILGI